jgi:hypothetical protein
VTLADRGYQGSAWAKVPYKGKNKPEPQKEANRAHAKLRAPVEGRTPSSNVEDPHQAAMLPWRAPKVQSNTGDRRRLQNSPQAVAAIRESQVRKRRVRSISP